MPAVPSSLSAILSLLGPGFSAPTFVTFQALVVGFMGRVGEHTICGMWQAARLAGRVHDSRAHDFFARASWCPDKPGLILLDFLIERFCEAGAPLVLAVDGSVFKRSGRKVHGAVWHHDAGAQPDGRGFKFGNCFVVVGLVVRIAVLGERAWCLLVLFRRGCPTICVSGVMVPVTPRSSTVERQIAVSGRRSPKWMRKAARAELQL
jgi:hypothetical protein